MACLNSTVVLLVCRVVLGGFEVTLKSLAVAQQKLTKQTDVLVSL